MKWNKIRKAAEAVTIVSTCTALMFLPVAASDVMTNGTKLVNDVSGWIVGLSTGAATIGVGTGALMKKLSMGKPDKIETGGKVMKASIGGWCVVNGITLILNTLKGYLS